MDPKEATGAAAAAVASRLAELQAKQAAREEARATRRTALDLKRAELVDKYEEELGAIDVAFAVVDVRDQGYDFIVLKRPDKAVQKMFDAAVTRVVGKPDPVPPDAIDRYVVASLLYPEAASYRAIADTFSSIPNVCAQRCQEMHTISKEAAKGKA